MIYPKNYEQKIGFDEIRDVLKGFCLSTLGKDKADAMEFSNDADTVNAAMDAVREMRSILSKDDGFPLDNFFDVRTSLKRIRLEGTHMEEDELFDLKRSLQTIIALTDYLNRGDEDDAATYTMTIPRCMPWPTVWPRSRVSSRG